MEIIFTSLAAFTSTNIDDVFILMLFFGDKSYKTTDIYFGQYLGITLLVLVSLVGSSIGDFIDIRYVGLMGLFPLYLGLKKIIALFRKRIEDEISLTGANFKTGYLSIATVTIANGGDNIGTYIPLFATLHTHDKVTMIITFLVMIYIFVSLARYLTNHPVLARIIAKYGHIATPIILCLLGIFILKESHSFDLLK